MKIRTQILTVMVATALLGAMDDAYNKFMHQDSVQVQLLQIEDHSLYIYMYAIFAVIVIIGIVTTSVQQAYAPRGCSGCTAFKKLTHEFEKDVIDGATNGDLNTIPTLLEQYNEDVRALELIPRG